jgi:hypothetical protein
VNWVKTQVVALVFVAGLTATWTAFAASEESPSTLLMRAWEEYGFQAWTTSDALFQRVVASAAASPDERFQARLGKAFVLQNQMPGRSPEDAAKLYAALLQDLPAKHTMRALALDCQGACLIDAKTPDYDKGRALLREAMATTPAQPLVVQDAALRLLSSYLKRPDMEQYKAGLAIADELLPRLKGATLEGVAHQMAAYLAFWTGDLKRCSAEREAQYRCGIESRAWKEWTMFNIARLSEAAFHDYGKAAEWYQRLHDELPAESRAYFSGLRAAELRAGKINSDYEPPLIPERAAAPTNAPAGQGKE